MESGGGALSGRRGDGASGDGGGGLVCQLCGYAYPISELQPAHAKICWKPISTAAMEEGSGELGDRGLLLGGDGGPSAVDCGCRLTASAPEDAATIRENACLSEGAVGGNTKRNVTNPISHEIPKNLEVKQEVTGAEPTSLVINEMHILFEEKEQGKVATADFVSHHEIIAETSASTSYSTVYEGTVNTSEHMRRRGVLLETPTGFAVFIVKEPLEAETAWTHFMDIATASKVVSLTGFIKLDDKSAIWAEGDGGASKELEHLIQKCLKDEKELLVDTQFKDGIEEKFGITCCDNDGIAGDLIWGLKNTLREFIPEEKHNITKEYYFPLSKGWNDFLLKYSIIVPASMRNSYLMSKIFLLRSLDLTLERVPKNLRKSFDRHVNGIGEHIKDDFMYVLVLARILVPELTPNYNFSKMFPSDMVLKIEEAKRFASNYKEELTLYDRQIILGALDQLGVVPGQIESAVAFIKLRLKEVEAATRYLQEKKMTVTKDGHGEGTMQNEKRSVWHPMVGLLVLGGIIIQLVSSRG